MKKATVTALVIAAALVAWVTFRTLTAPSAESLTRQVEDGVKVAAEELHARMPRKIDKMTTLVDVTSSGVVMTYHYKIDSNDYEVPPNFMKLVETIIIKDVCKSPDTKSAMKEGAVYAYSYINSDTKPLGTFIIKDGDCG